MRIIAEQNFRGIKITTFKHQTTVSIKFERESLEFSLKFRDDLNIQDESGAKKLLDAVFLNEIDLEMRRLDTARSLAVNRNFSIDSTDEELPLII